MEVAPASLPVKTSMAAVIGIMDAGFMPDRTVNRDDFKEDTQFMRNSLMRFRKMGGQAC